MGIKPCYFITATDTEEVVTTECVKVESGQFAITRTKRSANLEAARLLIPSGFHMIPDSGTSTQTIEWWISKPTWVEALRDEA